MLVKCTECSKEFSNQAARCIHCGAPNPTDHKPMGALAKFAFATGMTVILAFGALAVISGLLPDDPQREEKQRDRRAIENCREHQADELAELSTRRIVRRACDLMEQQFRRTYGVAP